VTDTSGAPSRNTGIQAILRSQKLVASGYFGGWQADTLVFTARRDSGVDLWSIKVDPNSGTAHGAAKRMMGGDRRNSIITSSLVVDSLAFCQMSPAFHVWRIDRATHPAQAKAYKITQDTQFDNGPRISGDGRWLAFIRGDSDANRNLYLIDTRTGSQRVIRSERTSKLAPLPNESGTAIAYEASEGGYRSIFLTGIDGVTRRLCEDCANPMGWGPDGDSILYSNSNLSEVRIMQLSGAEARTILSIPDGSVHDAAWSSRNHYIVFTVSQGDAMGQVFAASFSPGSPNPDRHWIEITDKSYYSRKPVWSGDGKMIFYLSTRDGFWCIWGQRFDPINGRLIGQPIGVYHFHDLKLSPAEMRGELFNLSAAGDSLYLNLAEFGGTIWAGRLAQSFPFLHHE
jgi:WD40 repeat protein